MKKCFWFFHQWGEWSNPWLSQDPDNKAVVKRQRMCLRCGEVHEKTTMRLDG